MSGGDAPGDGIDTLEDTRRSRREDARGLAVDVVVWTVDLARPCDTGGAWLDAGERAAAAERRGRARERFERAHAACRAVLAATSGLAPAEVRYVERPGAPGKPHLAAEVGGPPLSFNLAHAGALALVAVAAGVDVALGVDVETLRARPYLDRLARRTLTPDEHARWCAAEPGARLAAFLEAWTAKEALLKATGRGIRVPLSATPASAPAGWTLARVPVPAGAIAALAVAAPRAAVRTRAWG